MTTLNIQQYVQYDFWDYAPNILCILTYQTDEIPGSYILSYPVFIGPVQDLTTTPYPTFIDAESALAYYQSTNCASFLYSINQTNNTSYFTDYNIITLPPKRVFSNPARSLNTPFKISPIRDAIVTYGVDITSVLSSTSGQTGQISLQYADDNAFTVNIITVSQAINGSSGTMTVGTNISLTETITVNGMIPAGKYVQISTYNMTGIPSFAMRSSQEVWL